MIAHRLRVYLVETRYDLVRMKRNLPFLLMALIFPLVLYVILGLTFAGSVVVGDTLAPVYMLATYGTFGVVGISLGTVGMTISAEREKGLLAIKRASPMPPEAMIVSRLATGLVLNVIYVAALFVLGATFGGARLAAGQWLALGALLVAGTLPFATLGFAVGWMGKPEQAVGVANLIHLPLAFMSGLWIPLNQLPEVFRAIAPFLPQYHHAQLALHPIGATFGGAPLSHAVVLAGFSLLFAGLAIGGYKRYQTATA
jgi:ABC-2 type transport system permease protein